MAPVELAVTERAAGQHTSSEPGILQACRPEALSRESEGSCRRAALKLSHGSAKGDYCSFLPPCFTGKTMNVHRMSQIQTFL